MILDHQLLIRSSDDYAMIFSHDCNFSIYKRHPIHQKGVTTFSLFELLVYNFSVMLCLAKSPRSHLHTGGIFSSLTPTDDVCFLAQVAEINTELIEQFRLLVAHFRFLPQRKLIIFILLISPKMLYIFYLIMQFLNTFLNYQNREKLRVDNLGNWQKYKEVNGNFL